MCVSVALYLTSSLFILLHKRFLIDHLDDIVSRLIEAAKIITLLAQGGGVCDSLPCHSVALTFMVDWNLLLHHKLPY